MRHYEIKNCSSRKEFLCNLIDDKILKKEGGEREKKFDRILFPKDNFSITFSEFSHELGINSFIEYIKGMSQNKPSDEGCLFYNFLLKTSLDDLLNNGIYKFTTKEENEIKKIKNEVIKINNKLVIFIIAILKDKRIIYSYIYNYINLLIIDHYDKIIKELQKQKEDDLILYCKIIKSRKRYFSYGFTLPFFKFLLKTPKDQFIDKIIKNIDLVEDLDLTLSEIRQIINSNNVEEIIKRGETGNIFPELKKHDKLSSDLTSIELVLNCYNILEKINKKR